MTEKIQVNKSTCKKLLKSAGSNVAKDAIVTFQSKLSDFGITLAAKASALATNENRKTIKTEDVDAGYTEIVDINTPTDQTEGSE